MSLWHVTTMCRWGSSHERPADRPCAAGWLVGVAALDGGTGMSGPFDIKKARYVADHGDLMHTTKMLYAALDALEASQKRCEGLEKSWGCEFPCSEERWCARKNLCERMRELRLTVDAQAGVIQAQRIRIEYLEQAADGKEEDLLLQEEGILP